MYLFLMISVQLDIWRNNAAPNNIAQTKITGQTKLCTLGHEMEMHKIEY
jgi:hypothetical protein